MELKNYFHYGRNYVTSGSGIAGCDCTMLMRLGIFYMVLEIHMEKVITPIKTKGYVISGSVVALETSLIYQLLAEML